MFTGSYLNRSIFRVEKIPLLELGFLFLEKTHVFWVFPSFPGLGNKNKSSHCRSLSMVVCNYKDLPKACRREVCTGFRLVALVGESSAKKRSRFFWNFKGVKKKTSRIHPDIGGLPKSRKNELNDLFFFIPKKSPVTMLRQGPTDTNLAVRFLKGLFHRTWWMSTYPRWFIDGVDCHQQ